MKPSNELPGDVLDLLAQKTYSQLNHQEKQLVEAWLSPEAYDEYATMLSDFQELDASIERPSPTQQFPEKRPTVFRKLISYRIPAYQAVAAVVIALFLFNLGMYNNKSVDTLPDHLISVTDSGTLVPSPHQVIETGTESVGTPLSEDDYPEELVFNL